MSDQERKEFERWLNPGQHDGNVSPWVAPGRYEKDTHNLAWLAWKARAALAQQAVPVGYSVVKLSQCAYRTKRGAIYGGTTFCAGTTPLFEILEVHETSPAAMLAVAPAAPKAEQQAAEISARIDALMPAPDFLPHQGISTGEAPAMYYSRGVVREAIRAALSHVPAQPNGEPQAEQQAVPPEFDVRRIMLSVVPGEDGMGREVFAKNVDEVVATLTDLGVKLEDASGELVSARAALAAQQAEREPVGWAHVFAGEIARFLPTKSEAESELARLNEEHPEDAHKRSIRPLAYADGKQAERETHGGAVGWLYEGIAPHTKGERVLKTESVSDLETRWWREVGPAYVERAHGIGKEGE